MIVKSIAYNRYCLSKVLSKIAIVCQRCSYNRYYYTLHNILLYKSNKTIWMFYGKFADEGDNPVDTQTYIMLWEKIGCRPVYKPWLLQVGWKSWYFSVLFRNCIFYTGNYFVVLCKTKHSSHKHLDKTDIAFIWGIKLSTLERLFSWVPQVDNFQCSPHVKAIIMSPLRRKGDILF